MTESEGRAPSPRRGLDELEPTRPTPDPSPSGERTLPSAGCGDEVEPVEQRPCLEVDEVLAFVEGDLGGRELRRLNEHLDTCGRCQRLVFEATRAVDVEGEPLGDGAWNTMFQPGIVVAQRYRIRRFVARGGMGEVYEAFDQALGERVALKTVAATGSDSPRAVRRLKAEVQLARRVSHPNVCRIYDFGTHDLEAGAGPVHFLTMELVNGENLADWLRRQGAPPVEDALRIAREVLVGLGVAHEAGILHRDLKSANVMLRTVSGREPSAVIMDFGLARPLDPEALRQMATMSEGLAGTLSYMAPEQIEGGALTTASDIYAFGVVLYELLTGELPFAAQSWAEAVLDRLHKDPAPPSSLNSQIPRRLDAVVLRCLHRAPAQRYGTAHAVLAALDAVDRPGAPEGPARPARAVTAKRAALVALALGSILIGAWWVRPARTDAPRAEPGPGSSDRAASAAGGSAPSVVVTPASGGVTAPGPGPASASALEAPRAVPVAPPSRPSRAAVARTASEPAGAARSARLGAVVHGSSRPPAPAAASASVVAPVSTAASAAPRAHEPDWEKPDWGVSVSAGPAPALAPLAPRDQNRAE